MADFRGEYGGPIPQADEYGKPIHYTNTTSATPPAASVMEGGGTTTTDPTSTGDHDSRVAGMMHGTGMQGEMTTPTDAAPGMMRGGVVPTGHSAVAGVGGGRPQQDMQHHGVSGKLHRSGSSSSNSSEDNGQGGHRKKKGLKEKIKERLPGGHKKKETTGQQHDGQGQAGHEQEKKGVLEKIKEKLPGHHHHH